MVASVVFKGNLDSKTYNYLVEGFKVAPMDRVLVPVGNYGHVEVATVVAVWCDEVNTRYSGCDIQLKKIIALADREVLLDQMRDEIHGIEQKYTKLFSKLE